MKSLNLALTYDDVQLIPQYSEVESRSEVSLTTQLSRNFNLMIPFVASPMDTVCGYDMALAMLKMGGVGCIHRFMSIGERVSNVSRLHQIANPDQDKGSSDSREVREMWGNAKIPIMVACGLGEREFGIAASCIIAGANVILIDVAHGHHKKVREMIGMLLNYRGSTGRDFDIIAGNIATAKAAKDLSDWGVDGIRVGIGGGCFIPETEVNTDTGLKRIKDVHVGDLVYTHKNRLRTVTDKFKYYRDETLLEINGIQCTPNHEFYVVHKKYEDVVHENNVEHYAEWVRADQMTDEYLLVEY